MDHNTVNLYLGFFILIDFQINSTWSRTLYFFFFSPHSLSHIVFCNFFFCITQVIHIHWGEKLEITEAVIGLTHWKRPWCCERLKAGEGDDRRWNGWMASLTQWTWVWVSSRSWWWTGSLACCSPWGHKESDMTERLNGTELTEAVDKKESKSHLLSFPLKKQH